jgi:hypothetical protein
MTKLQIQAHGSFTPGPPPPCVRREWPTNDRISLTLVRTGIAIRINPDGHLEELISDLAGGWRFLRTDLVPFSATFKKEVGDGKT